MFNTIEHTTHVLNDGGCEATLLQNKLLHTVLDKVSFAVEDDSMAIVPYVSPSPSPRSSSNLGLCRSSSFDSFQGSPTAKPSNTSMDELEEMESFLDRLPSKHLGIDNCAYCPEVV